MLLEIISANFFVSLIAFIGIFYLLLKAKTMEKILKPLISFAAGVLIAGAFFCLIPEILTFEFGFQFVVFGLVSFFVLERFLFWRHCHKGKCEIHEFAYLNLVGDFIHNFLDGVIIAASFLINFNFGIITTFLVAIHEIPQEIGDFAVLIYGGIKRKKALLLNFLVALASVLGGIFGYFFMIGKEFIIKSLIAIAAGGFIYISLSDLIPEIRKERKIRREFFNLIAFLIGILILYFLVLRI